MDEISKMHDISVRCEARSSRKQNSVRTSDPIPTSRHSSCGNMAARYLDSAYDPMAVWS